MFEVSVRIVNLGDIPHLRGGYAPIYAPIYPPLPQGVTEGYICNHGSRGYTGCISYEYIGVVYLTYKTWPQHYKNTSPSNSRMHDAKRARLYAGFCSASWATRHLLYIQMFRSSRVVHSTSLLVKNADHAHRPLASGVALESWYNYTVRHGSFLFVWLRSKLALLLGCICFYNITYNCWPRSDFCM